MTKYILYCALLVLIGIMVLFSYWKQSKAAVPDSVLLVFPTDFVGLAKLCGDQPRHSTSTAKCEVVVINANGLGTSGRASSFFHLLHIEAQLSNGSPLPIWDAQRLPKSGEKKGVWLNGDSVDQRCIYFFVGPPESREEAGKAYLRVELGENGVRLSPASK